MKKLLIVSLFSVWMLTSVTACSRRGPAPELDTVYDRLVEVIREQILPRAR